METIGFLELNSIAKGIEVAEVRLITARPSCPGKYHVLITGEVAAVQAAAEAGEQAAAGSVVDQVVIPRIHPQVIAAVGLSSVPERANAVGILEFFSVTAFPARVRYAALAKRFGCCCYTEVVAAQGLVRKIQDLMTETGMPHKLENAEHRALVSEHLDRLAEAALADRCTGGNPRPAQLEQVKELYRKLL